MRPLEGITPKTLLTRWLDQPVYWFLVGVAIMLSVLDVLWTWSWIQYFGVSGEANPATRWFFQNDLQILWSGISITLTSVGAVMMSSLCEILVGVERRLPVIGLSLLLALKCEVVLFHLFLYTDVMITMIVLLLAGPTVFVLVRALLQQRAAYALVHVLSRWIEAAKDAKVLLISRVSASQKVRSIETPVTPQTDRSHPLGAPTGRKGQTRRVVIWVIVMILAPTVGLLLIEFISYMAGVPSLPDWMKRLGIVSQQQGRVFGLSLIVILVVTGVLVYALLAIFDALGER